MTTTRESEIKAMQTAWEMIRAGIEHGYGSLLFNEFDGIVYLKNIGDEPIRRGIPSRYAEEGQPTVTDMIGEPKFAVTVKADDCLALDSLFYDMFPQKHQHVFMQIMDIVHGMGRTPMYVEEDDPQPGILTLTRDQMEWLQAFCNRIASMSSHPDYDCLNNLTYSIKDVLDDVNRENVDDVFAMHANLEAFAPDKGHRGPYITVHGLRWAENTSSPERVTYHYSIRRDLNGGPQSYEIDLSQDLFQQVMGLDHNRTLAFSVKVNYDKRRLVMVGPVGYPEQDGGPAGDPVGVDAEYAEQVLANLGAVDL